MHTTTTGTTATRDAAMPGNVDRQPSVGSVVESHPAPPPAPVPPPGPWGSRVLADGLRFLGLAVGLLIVVNVVGELVRPPFDTLRAWISLGAPAWLRLPFAALTAAVLVAHAIGPFRRRSLRVAGSVVCGVVAALALVDAVVFYRVLAAGTIRTPAVVPSSLLVACCFLALAWQIAFEKRPRPRWTARRIVAATGTCAAVALVIPLVLIATFGPTRYDRRADCAVVLGARVWSDGTPSLALADRVDEAVSLYRRGLVDRIVMSGAVEGGGLSEPRVMADRAAAAGVPREALWLDEAGVDTASTAENTARLMRERGLRSVLVVSHYYHEPRLKMLFDRAGVRAYTVPARMSRHLRKEPWFVLREVAAYYHSFLLQ